METAESPQYLLSPAVLGSPPAGLINAARLTESIRKRRALNGIPTLAAGIGRRDDASDVSAKKEGLTSCALSQYSWFWDS